MLMIIQQDYLLHTCLQLLFTCAMSTTENECCFKIAASDTKVKQRNNRNENFLFVFGVFLFSLFQQSFVYMFVPSVQPMLLKNKLSHFANVIWFCTCKQVLNLIMSKHVVRDQLNLIRISLRHDYLVPCSVVGFLGPLRRRLYFRNL